MNIKTISLTAESGTKKELCMKKNSAYGGNAATCR